MKYDLEQASLLYLGKLLSNENYYTEELEDTYINLKGAIEERDKLQQENKQLKQQLKQRDEVIDKVINLNYEVIKMINKGYSREQYFGYIKKALDILQKYKGDNK